MRIPWPAILLLILPVAEIAGFIIVGRQIGVLATLALIFATSFLGLLLLRIQGLSVLSRIRSETDRGHVPGREMVHGAMILFAGLLLLLPGFLTDLVGLLLFIPPIRDLGWKMLGRRVVMADVGRPGGTGGRILDLDEGEYDSPPRPDSPWRPD